MAIEAKPSNMILLFPPHNIERIENRYKTSETATPGHFAELHDDSGTLKWRKNASSTESHTLAIYLENGMMNKGITDVWAANDLVRVAMLQPGDIVNALPASGQTITYAEKLQIGAGGTVITAGATTADANLARLQSLDNPGLLDGTDHIRVQVVS